MTCHRICDQQRQPCPSAWLCEMGCNFTEATKETPREKAERQFIEMDLPIQFLDDEPEDEKPPFAGVLLIWACGLVAFCLLGSLMVPR